MCLIFKAKTFKIFDKLFINLELIVFKKKKKLCLY